MAITNWKSVGESAFEADMKRSQLALQAEQQRQNQARWETERADRNRIREEEKQWRDKTYADQREDVKANRDFERQKWNAQREDVKQNRDFERQKWNAQREDVKQNRDFEQQKYLDRLDQDAFDNEIKAEKMNQQTALFEREMQAYNDIQAKKEAAQAASKTSLAAMLAYGIRNGDRDAQGRIFIPTDAMNVFNASLAQATGANRANYKGAVLITKDANGNPLNGMQVALLKEDGTAEVIPQAELAGLVDAYPSLKGEYDGLMGQLFPKTSSGFDNNYYKYLNDSLDDVTSELKYERGNKDTLNNLNNPSVVNALTLKRNVQEFMRDHYMRSGEKLTYEDAVQLYKRATESRLGLGRRQPATQQAVDDDLAT
jgi:hypothetical protein